MQKFFLGIDFSSSHLAKKGKTVVVILAQKQGEDRPCVEEIIALRNNTEFTDFLGMQKFDLCGLDSPLSLPSCVLCQKTNCDCPLVHWRKLLGIGVEDFYHYRLSDILIRKAIPPLSPKPALSNGGPVDITPLTLRWLHLSRLLKQQNIATNRIIEVYGSGAIQIYAKELGLSEEKNFHYRRSEENRELLLSKISRFNVVQIKRELFEIFVNNEDAFDALFVALTSWHVANGYYLSPENLLSLSNPPSWVRSLSHIPKIERLAMKTFLEDKQWSFLPIPTL